MGLRIIVNIFMIFGVIYNVHSAKMYIGHSPDTLTFTSAEALRLSELADVIAGSLGYTTVSSWPGLNIKSPFNYPLAFVLVNVAVNDHNFQMNGQMYNVKQDLSINSVYTFIQSKLKAQSERSLSFQDVSVSEMMTNIKPTLQPDLLSLDEAIIEDESFIHDIEILPRVIEKIEKLSSIGFGGQDITFVEVESLNPLIAKYGSNSSQVKEADYMLRQSLMSLEKKVRKFYRDRVVFASVFTNDVHHITKRTTFTDSKEDLEDVNLATPCSEDFPVVFNIVLFLSILLILAIIAASASMALMDPGHDSIIYRMTNPRMKKD